MTNSIPYICSLIVVFAYPITFTLQTLFSQVQVQSLEPKPLIVNTFPLNLRKPRNIVFRFFNYIISRPTPFNFSCKNGYTPLSFLQSLKLKSLISVTILVSKLVKLFTNFESKPLNLTQNIYLFRFFFFIKSRPKPFNFSCKYEYIPMFFYQSLQPKSLNLISKLVSKFANHITDFESKPSNFTQNLVKHEEIVFQVISCFSLEPESVSADNQISRSKICTYTTNSFLPIMCKKSKHTRVTHRREHSSHSEIYIHRLVNIPLRFLHVITPNMIARLSLELQLFSNGVCTAKQFVYDANLLFCRWFYYRICIYSHVSCYRILAPHMIVRLLSIIYYFPPPPDNKKVIHKPKAYCSLSEVLCFLTKCYCFLVNLLLFYKKVVALLSKVYYLSGKILLIAFQLFLIASQLFLIAFQLLFDCFSVIFDCFSVIFDCFSVIILIAFQSLVYRFWSNIYCFSPLPNNKKIYYKNSSHVIKHLQYTNIPTLDIHLIAVHKFISYTFYKCCTPLKCVVRIIIKLLCY